MYRWKQNMLRLLKHALLLGFTIRLVATIAAANPAEAEAAGKTKADEQTSPPAAQIASPLPSRLPETETGPGLRMNFRGVPLDTVLNYLSDAAGFVIVLETKVEGKVDAWSHEPLNKTEAVD